MKLIEGLKQIKDLTQKAADLRAKISLHCAHLNIEGPTYDDQKKQVAEWLQAHEDLTREIANLHVRISRTNLAAMITIGVGGNTLTKSITEWVIRRRTTAQLDLAAWSQLGDRGLKEQNFKSSPDAKTTEVRVVRCFDPVVRDNKITLYKGEPNQIDRALEVANAVTELLD